MRYFSVAIVSALLAIGMPGCSALGLSSFAIAACTDSSQCAAVNNHHHVAADACERFVCAVQLDATGHPVGGRAGTCVRGLRDDDADGVPNAACAPPGTTADCDDTNPLARAGTAEVCDGADNDCDGVIDEQVSPFANERLVSPGVTAISAVSTRGSFAVVGGSTPSLVRTSQSTSTPQPMPYRAHASLGADPERTPGSGVPLCLPQRSGSLADAALVTGCPSYSASATYSIAPVSIGTCDVADAVIAESGTGGIVATVNALGCAPGQLRVGLLTAPEAPAIELRGPIARSNLFLGVDLDGPCTAMGVAGMAIDSTSDGTRALLGFLDASRTRACGAGPAPLRLMGIERQSAPTATSMVDVVNGTGGGVPLLADDASSGSPGLAHVPDGAVTPSDSYVVAYGHADGSLIVSTVSFPTMALLLPRVSDESANACIVNTPTTSHALATPAMRAAIHVDAPPEAVAVAVLGTAAEATPELGVAFQHGCGSTARIGFVIVRSDGTTTPVVDLGAGQTPSVVAVADRIVTPGHHGATATTTGGYIIGFVAADGFAVTRVASADGQALAQTRQVSAGATAGRLWTNDTDHGAVWTDGAGIHAATITCASTTSP